MKPYPNYKPSGVPWLGDVPSHWDVERLRFRVKLNPSFSNPLSSDLPVSFLPMDAISDDGILDLERTRLVGEVASGYTYFEDGDVAIAKITPCYENGKGAVMKGLREGVGFGTTELIVMRPIQTDVPEWLYYLTMCSAFRLPGEALMQGAGGQKRVPDLFVKDYFAPVPPPGEQQAIVDYLDAETARIDELMQEKNELIRLLREWRQTVIAEAVTKGLDTSVTMRSSGISWLWGDVPTQWKTKKVKHIASMRSGEGITAERIEDDGPFPVYGGNGLRGFTDTATHKGEFVLVGRQGALCGNVHHVKGEFWASEHAVVSDLYAGDSPHWATYMLEFMNLRQYSMAAAQPGLAVDKILQLRLPVPPIAEQQTIADYLDSETTKIDKLIAHTTEEIALLNELRAATIADAVLGRIKVC